MNPAAIALGVYDYYTKKSSDSKKYGIYQPIANKTLETEQGIFSIVMLAAVYASGIAFFVSVITLVIATFGNNQKLAEGKMLIIRVVIITFCIFAVTGAVTLVQRAGLG